MFEIEKNIAQNLFSNFCYTVEAYIVLYVSIICLAIKVILDGGLL